jgi:hypothetical protein
LIRRSELAAVRYVLIPVADIERIGRSLEADELSDRERDALARAFKGTIRTCELLVTYALGVAGKPSRQ